MRRAATVHVAEVVARLVLRLCGCRRDAQDERSFCFYPPFEKGGQRDSRRAATVHMAQVVVRLVFRLCGCRRDAQDERSLCFYPL